MNISAWKVLLHSDMHACFLTILYLLQLSRIEVLSYDFLWKVLSLIASLGLYLVYMFLVNDYFDMPTDKIAGKKRQIHDMPSVQVVGLILLIMLLSYVVTIFLVGQPLYTLIYVMAYFLATLYSAPPLRLKSKGLLGTICAALIEKPLPALLVFSFFQYFELDALIVFLFFFLLQVEMITHHQFLDYEGDLKSQVRTYVVETGLDKASRILNYLQLLVFLFSLVVWSVVLIKMPYSVIFFIFLPIGYFFAQKLRRSNLLIRGTGSMDFYRFYREDTITHFYYSFMLVCFTGIFPLYLGLMLTMKVPLYGLLLLLTIASQYYLIKMHYQPLLRGAFLLIERIYLM